jgi:putative acetyltransferase
MVRDETPEDYEAVDDLLRAAFGRPDEADAVAAARLDRDARGRCLVAVVSDHSPGGAMADLGAGDVVGFLRLLPTPLADGEGLTLSPVAVRPARQRQGVGTYLVQFALEMEADAGGHRVIAPDDSPFWDRFGLIRQGASQ